MVHEDSAEVLMGYESTWAQTRRKYSSFVSFWLVKSSRGRLGASRFNTDGDRVLADEKKQICCPCHLTNTKYARLSDALSFFMTQKLTNHLHVPSSTFK